MRNHNFRCAALCYFSVGYLYSLLLLLVHVSRIPSSVFSGMLRRLSAQAPRKTCCECLRCTCPQAGTQFEPEKLRLAAKVPYAANTLVMFINTPQALHAVTPRSFSSLPRRFVNIVAQVILTVPNKPCFVLLFRPFSWSASCSNAPGLTFQAYVLDREQDCCEALGLSHHLFLKKQLKSCRFIANWLLVPIPVRQFVFSAYGHAP